MYLQTSLFPTTSEQNGVNRKTWVQLNLPTNPACEARDVSHL